MKIRKNIHINTDISSPTPLYSYVRYNDFILQKSIGECIDCFFYDKGCNDLISKGYACFCCIDEEESCNFIEYEDKK